jgi:hypothetical protein
MWAGKRKPKSALVSAERRGGRSLQRTRVGLDDAVQGVFVECFRQGGILDRVEPARLGYILCIYFGSM